MGLTILLFVFIARVKQWHLGFATLEITNVFLSRIKKIAWLLIAAVIINYVALFWIAFFAVAKL
jgi:hypothetical protein